MTLCEPADLTVDDGGALVRLPPGVLCRATAEGYLLHTGRDVVAVTGADAEVWAQAADGVYLDVLIDRQAESWGDDRADTAQRVLQALVRLTGCHALEVVAG